MTVSIVIPTWNGRQRLLETLAAVMAQSIECEIIVIDNGSVDGTGDWIRSTYPSVAVIRNERNLGFAAAVNQGIELARSAWIALLNDDAVPDADWLERMLEVGSKDARVGSVASRMMFRSAPSLISSAGISFDTSGGAWDLWIGHSGWPRHGVEVFGASAGAGLYRRTMLDDIGLFDEAFFAYFEDVDLAWRARLRGWRAVLAPNARVVHAVSATSGEGSDFKNFHLARNKWRVIVRNYPAPGLVRHWYVIVAYDALSVANSLRRGDRAPLRGRKVALSELAALLEQRRTIQRSRTASWAELKAVMTPVASPLALYQRGKLVARYASPSRR